MRPLRSDPRRMAAPPLTRGRGPDLAAHDPAPSIWSYRFQRLWLTPLFRAMVRVGLPIFVVVAGAGVYLSDPHQRQIWADQIADLRRQIESRPEFQVNLLTISGASADLGADIREGLALDFPLSSFDLDLVALKARIEELAAVKDAGLRIENGVLQVTVVEREAALVWQTREAFLLIDAQGVVIDDLARRPLATPLPIVGGEGADRAAAEALAIFDAASPIRDQIRGLVRVGERRWDVILVDDRRILLPEFDAVAVFERVIALNEAQDLLARDLRSVDMRDPARPTLRRNPPAQDTDMMIQPVSSGEAYP